MDRECQTNNSRVKMLRNILSVAVGGAFGAICRYLISIIITTAFPIATLTINVIGSLLIGFFMGLSCKGIISPEIKQLLAVGFCGGFTTFSTFTNESLNMIKAGDMLMSAIYIGSSVTLGILAVWLGEYLAECIK